MHPGDERDRPGDQDVRDDRALDEVPRDHVGLVRGDEFAQATGARERANANAFVDPVGLRVREGADHDLGVLGIGLGAHVNERIRVEVESARIVLVQNQNASKLLHRQLLLEAAARRRHSRRGARARAVECPR
jgi:hypothetical protein